MGETPDRGEWRSPPSSIVILGGSGDLTSRKLGPALFALWREGYLGEPFSIIGSARREKSHEQFREELREGVEQHGRLKYDSAEQWNQFASGVFYEQGDLTDSNFYERLKARLDSVDQSAGVKCNRLFYLAIAPQLFGTAAQGLSSSGLAKADASPGAARVIVEKPFGHDEKSAAELNRELLRLLDENQIFRIDHYLGKETVQDILAFRFGNSIFEPLFNSRYVDHVQITVAETVGMEGNRGAYYDGSGALRDMVQNHLLQLLCLVAMEPPVSFEAEPIHNEKIKVLRALKLFDKARARDVVRGQYGSEKSEGAYREAPGVNPESTTETFVAMRLAIENWRWAGTPFYLRTGKCLAKRASEICVQFNRPPLSLFESVGHQRDRCDIGQARPNQLLFRIQPDGGISLSFASKAPGMEFQLQTVEMDFDYRGELDAPMPEAYERLLLDALRGDSTLFTRADQVEYAWRLVDSIRQTWTESPPPEFPNYAPGDWGPTEANRLFHGGHCSWRRL